MDYQRFETEDLIADEYFVSWVLTPDPENDAFWMEWMAKNPHQSKQVEEAKNFILALEFEKPEISVERTYALLDHIHQEMERNQIKKNSASTLAESSSKFNNSCDCLKWCLFFLYHS